jgi:ribonuclease P protein component
MVSARAWPVLAAAASLTRAAPRGASVSLPKLALTTIKNRRDFLAANHAQKFVTSCFILQMRERPADHPVKDSARVGFTVTKKMGNAVARNRIKRRLREALRKAAPPMKEGVDYVIISRTKALTCEFSELTRDMLFAFSRIGAK